MKGALGRGFTTEPFDRLRAGRTSVSHADDTEKINRSPTPDWKNCE